MHPYLKTRRRLFAHAVQTYIRADAAWRQGLRDAAVLVPELRVHGVWMIGNPGSRMRRLYEERNRALDRMASARAKLAVARRRLARRQGVGRIDVVMLGPV